MDLNWVKHLPSEQHEDFIVAVRNSRLALGRLYDLLLEFERGVQNQEVREPDYDHPAWSHRQAHRNGEVSAYRKIRQLLEFINQKKP